MLALESQVGVGPSLEPEPIRAVVSYSKSEELSLVTGGDSVCVGTRV